MQRYTTRKVNKVTPWGMCRGHLENNEHELATKRKAAEKKYPLARNVSATSVRESWNELVHMERSTP